ncbi:MAG: hypothetical protein QF701_15700, partial [Nitrospinota bacterium]|nr:hypothetical protein [Nitrospinota bacterium]
KTLGKCPRRIGLVSQGLVVSGLSEAVNQLLGRQYTCVIVDEAHRARRRKLPNVNAGADEIDERVDPNKLMAFLREIGPVLRKKWIPSRLNGLGSRFSRGEPWRSPQLNLKFLFECANHQTSKALI